ncbi:MAG: LamG-like jellyroll fold domain-containing protein, partial [Candidatus Roizmanbacteria bacterium]
MIRDRSPRAGFTLIELLVATGIIGILMTVVLVAVNPFRMFAAAQQTKRSSDVSTIGKSLDMYLISAKGVFPTQMYPLNTPKRIAKNSGGPEADLCALLSTQIPGLPIDPTTPGTVVKDCTGSYNTGYNAVANASGKIGVYSPTGISLANATGMNVITYGYVPDDFITPPSPITAYKGQWGLDETTSTDTNQFKASGYLDTGKLGQAVSVYGNAAGTAGSTLTFNRGAQISGNNYEHINTNQGTISFWVKPSWNGNDNKGHTLFSDVGGSFWVVKDSSNNLKFVMYDNTGVYRIATLSASGWTSGTWYQVTVRWNANNPVTGSNYMEVYINGSNSGGTNLTTSYAVRVPANPLYIGSQADTTISSQSLIDDFAIFDRVLSTTEITSLYNSGTGNEAGYVADSSLKFYAKMDGSGTLSPVTYNGGASASKMTAKSTELAGGTNLLADGNMEAAGVTNWTATNPNLAAGAAITKDTSTVFADMQSLKIDTTGLTNGGASQTVSVGSSSNYTVSFWYKGNTYFRVRDTAGGLLNKGGNINSGGIWLRYEEAFKTGASTSGAYLEFANSGATVYYLDNITLTPNLVDNGGMEGQYTATGTALYSATI